MTIATTTYAEKKNGEFPIWRNFVLKTFFSTGDFCPRCICFLRKLKLFINSFFVDFVEFFLFKIIVYVIL